MERSSGGIKLVLHGRLRKLCPESSYTFQASSVYEAIRAFATQLRKELTPKAGARRLRIQAVGYDSIEHLQTPTGSAEVHLVPDFALAKSGGFIQIAIGALLIAAAIFMPASLAALTVVNGVSVGAMVFGIGASLVLGGLLAMMSPSPKMDTNFGDLKGDPAPSKYLGSPKNTVAVGTRIPFGYGRCAVAGHFLSFNMDAKDIAL